MVPGRDGDGGDGHDHRAGEDGHDHRAGGGGDSEYRLYRELAPWWPLISPPAEYGQDAELLTAILDEADPPARSVLDLGSGGGHVAAHLAAGRSMTLVDLSAEMLAVSRQLNPDCEHIQGDMRAIRLGREFDAVLVHDAVDYITTEDGLRQVIQTAFVHCRPGGLAIFAPDHTAETFRAGAGSGGGSGTDGRRASFFERTSDPDPADDWILAQYEFTLREADGTEQVVTESHRLGSFGQRAWLRLLAEAGFTAQVRRGVPAVADTAPGRVIFTGHRPPGQPRRT